MRPAIAGSARTSAREVQLLVPGTHRVALDEAIRLVAREPRLDEREEDALAEVEAVARLEVRSHPLRPHDEPFDEPGEAVEHVVDREEGVRQHDALRRRVRDVALVPERHVLEPDDRRGPHDAREPADPLGRRSGCACAASPTSPSARARTALRPRAPRSARDAGSRARSARATSRASASAFSSSAWRSRWRIWVELGAGSSPSRSQAIRSTSGSAAA